MNQEPKILDMDELLDARDVRKILKCSLPWVYKAATQGVIPCVKIPCKGQGREKHLVRFLKSDIFDFIKVHYQGNN